MFNNTVSSFNQNDIKKEILIIDLQNFNIHDYALEVDLIPLATPVRSRR